MSISPAMPNLAGDIQYKSGEIHTTVNNTVTVQDVYSTYQNHTIGFYTLLMAGLILALIFFERRQYDND